MVNGKPQLTFGSGQVDAPAKKRPRAGLQAGGRIGTDFASFLPLAEQDRHDVAGNGPRVGDIGSVLAQARAAQGALSPQLLSQSSAWARPGAAAPVAEQAADAAPAPARSAPSHATRGNAPAGIRSLSEARAVASAAIAAAGRIGRAAARTAPRISAQPITGRSGFGMVDTRLGGTGRGIGTAGEAREYSAAMTGALRKRPSETLQPGRGVPPAPDAYINFGARYQSAWMQSFVTHGFASKNAENALKNLGYDVNDRRGKFQASARLLQANDDAAQIAARSDAQGRKKAPLPAHAYARHSLVPAFYAMADQNIGVLAAKFESGAEGIAAIGYDRTGGTSYGKYQISSRAGTMKNFLEYLETSAPDLARRLAAAGPANTGGRKGKMPLVWRQIAAEQPERFELLQSDFIRSSHFEPAMNGIAEATGIGFASLPPALQEVLFSTAVQHGPAGAVRIISSALKTMDDKLLRSAGEGPAEQTSHAGRQLIQRIYSLRAGQFASSTARVQSAVRDRLRREMREAMEMLG